MDILEKRDDEKFMDTVLLARSGNDFFIIASSGFKATIPICACAEENRKCLPRYQHWNEARIRKMYDVVAGSLGMKAPKEKDKKNAD